MNTDTRLEAAFQSALRLPLDGSSRYVLFSDCHRGSGTHNDNFLTNRHIYHAAIRYYFDRGFTYIELGDGDELWENRSMAAIVDIHADVFQMLSRFQAQNRLFMLYGNHDIVKKHSRFGEKYLTDHYCTDSQCIRPLLPGLRFYEGIILERTDCPRGSIYLTHGHQVSLLNSALWPLARFLVRYLWLPLERMGFRDPTSAAKNYTTKKRAEERLCRWAEKKRHIVISGHTHRPVLRPKSMTIHNNEPYVFNTGSCVHPANITCIEIENDTISLIKWFMNTRSGQNVYIARESVSGPHSLADFD